MTAKQPETDVIRSLTEEYEGPLDGKQTMTYESFKLLFQSCPRDGQGKTTSQTVSQTPIEGYSILLCIKSLLSFEDITPRQKVAGVRDVLTLDRYYSIPIDRDIFMLARMDTDLMWLCKEPSRPGMRQQSTTSLHAPNAGCADPSATKGASTMTMRMYSFFFF